jgi:coenzyme Q-binding protein COQ10
MILRRAAMHAGKRRRMKSIHSLYQKHFLPHSVERVFDVVADVSSYSEFLPYCRHSAIVRRHSECKFDAEMVVGFGLVEERYTSNVTLRRHREVCAAVSDSHLFHYLINTWTFAPARRRHDAVDGCFVQFSVDFAFRSELLRRLTELVFDEVHRHMLKAFALRCDQLYGRGDIKA